MRSQRLFKQNLMGCALAARNCLAGFDLSRALIQAGQRACMAPSGRSSSLRPGAFSAKATFLTGRLGIPARCVGSAMEEYCHLR